MVANGKQKRADRIGSRSRASRDRQSRRMALLRRSGLFTGETNGAIVLRAVNVEDLLAAYRLVHDAFVERGYIRAQSTGLRMRAFEALGTTATFVAKAEGTVVGVQSLAVDDPHLGLPSDGAFQAEIDKLRGRGRLVCEATNEAVDVSWRKTAVPTELMRCCFAHALAIGCTDIITTVSPGHAKFYQLLGFQQISDVRSYSKGIDDPVVVVHFDLSALEKVLEDIQKSQDEAELFLKKYYVDDNPYQRHVRAWAVLSERLDSCTAQELRAIEANWGAELVGKVCGDQGESGRKQPTRSPERSRQRTRKAVRPEEQRARQLVGKLDSGQLSPTQRRKLRRWITEEIGAAVAEEREACAKTVEWYLGRGRYHVRGLTGAIRERADASPVKGTSGTPVTTGQPAGHR